MPVIDTHIKLGNVTRSFLSREGQTLALKDVSLSVARQEFVVLLGPSGCGKTTLLRLIAGLIAPDSGKVLVDGDVPVPGRTAAIMFQSFRLLPWKTAAQNVAFALAGLSPQDRRARVDEYLRLVGLERFAGSFPAALSGGMRQRLALARALACEPSILLMDEPFASLDAQSRELMQAELMRLTAGRPCTVVFVTHSVDEALLLGDRIVLMSPRPGQIQDEMRVPFPRPRWQHDPRADPRFAAMRAELWARLRDMVLNDPESDFYGRRPGG